MVPSCMQAASALGARRAAALFAGSLLAAVISLASFSVEPAYAWFTDAVSLSNGFTIAAGGKEEPYAALYKDPASAQRTLVFDRASAIPSSWNGRALEASWHGMEKGDQDFSADAYASSIRPSRFKKWQDNARNITEVACGGKAAADPIHVLNPQYWFFNLSKAKTIDVSGITPDAFAEGDARNRRSIQSMFKGCSSLVEIKGLEGWDMAGMEDAECCFDGCKALKALDVSRWDVSSLKTIPQMFRDCSSLRSLDLSGWDTRSCTAQIKFLFSNCSNLEEIKGSSSLRFHGAGQGWNAFYNCKRLKRLDLSGSGGEPDCALTFCTGMFMNCSSLTHLDISGIKLASNAGDEHLDMFYGLSSLSTFITSNRMEDIAPEPPTPPGGQGAAVEGCWVSEGDGDAFNGAELAAHLGQTRDAEAGLPFRILSFTASERAVAAAEEEGPTVSEAPEEEAMGREPEDDGASEEPRDEPQEADGNGEPDGSDETADPDGEEEEGEEEMAPEEAEGDVTGTAPKEAVPDAALLQP